MDEKQEPLDKIALSQPLRMNATVLGLTLGILLGLGIFVATIWLVIKGGEVVGPNLGLLSQYFIGYDVTFVGSLIGLAYGLIVGFLIGFFLANIYNWLVDRRNNGGKKYL